MTFATSALVVVHLVTTLCAVTLSEEIPLTCPDTARRELKDISKIYNCTPFFVPELKVAVCAGVVYIDLPGKAYYLLARITLTFKILEEVPEGTAMCLGLQNLHVNIQRMLIRDVLEYSFDFNPLLAVGILTADHNTTETDRSYSISLLSDVFNLTILSKFNLWASRYWNFSSPLLRTEQNWIQSLSIDGVRECEDIQLTWLARLQNTSIQLLSVSNILNEGKKIKLKDMPFLREINFYNVTVKEFHRHCFLGMPQMEVLILQDTYLTGIPEVIGRMSNLKTLKIVRGSQEYRFTIPTKELSTLKNLEVLNLKYNVIYWILGRLSTFSKLRILNLDSCQLSSIEKNDFVGIPQLEELTLSNNKLTHLEENIFRRLEKLKLLDLSFNKLTNWPGLNDFSFVLLDMSHNLLSDVCNLGNNRTTVKNLNVSNNRILHWDDKEDDCLVVLPLKTKFTTTTTKLSMTHSEDINKKHRLVFTARSTETNHFFRILGLSTTQRAELSTPLISGSKRKLLRIPANLSLANSYDKTKKPKSENGEKIIVNTFDNTIDYSPCWVKTINMSYNLIPDLSETMMQSLEGIHEVDLGGNEFDCVDCRMIPFQKWLNTTSTNVSNLGTSDPLLCSYPVTQKGTPVNLVQYDEEPCSEKILVRTTSLLMLIGVPVGVMSILVAAAGGVIYKFRSKIAYMLHLYKIKRRAQEFSRSASNNHAFDAFICYSSNDRRFVLTRLAPLLEKGQERYCLCLHERDFPMGSDIVSNIVGSIQHSRKIIIVLSEHFISSKWCNWELEMANHKMLSEDEHFVILIQLEKLDRNELPRHLQFMMDTRTFLEWPPSGHNDEEDVAAERLKEALGPSILQTTREKPPALSELMEDY